VELPDVLGRLQLPGREFGVTDYGSVGRVGVAAARATLAVEHRILWCRDRQVYTAGGKDFSKYSEAEAWVLAQPKRGET
jgi:hypothetical protein